MFLEKKMRSVYYRCTIFTKKKMECIFRFLKSPQTKFRADSFAILAVLHADRQNDKNCESVKIKLSIVLNLYFAFPEFHFSRRAWAVSLETFNFYFGNFCGTRRYWSAEVPYKQSALFFQRTGQFEQYCSNIRVYFNIFNKWNFRVKSENGKIVPVPTRRRIPGVEIQNHSFLTSAVGEGEWSVSCPGHYTIGKEPRYPLKRRMGGPQSQSGRFIEVKISFLRRCLNPL